MHSVKTQSQRSKQPSSDAQLPISTDTKSMHNAITDTIDVMLVTTGRKRQNRCGHCPGCLNTDCNRCKFCLDKPKNGGPGLKKQCCIKRKCIRTAKAEADVADAISRLHSLRDMYGKFFF